MSAFSCSYLLFCGWPHRKRMGKLSAAMMAAVFSENRRENRAAGKRQPPGIVVAGAKGIEPPTPGFGDRCSSS